jgi:hypothetical protein
MMKHIEETIERHMQMERDAAIIKAIRAGVVRSIASMGDGRWRVDTDMHFYVRDTLEAAMMAAMNEVSP